MLLDQFWVPQMFASLSIGGLTTADLSPNATLDTDWNYDAFFASFSEISHSSAVFSVYMYDHVEDKMLGSYREPGDGSVVIISFNGRCRFDRPYDASKRRRVHTINETSNAFNISRIPNFNNCRYSPSLREWFIKGQSLGSGRAEWTEPYAFSEGPYGKYIPDLLRLDPKDFVTKIEHYLP